MGGLGLAVGLAALPALFFKADPLTKGFAGSSYGQFFNWLKSGQAGPATMAVIGGLGLFFTLRALALGKIGAVKGTFIAVGFGALLASGLYILLPAGPVGWAVGIAIMAGIAIAGWLAGKLGKTKQQENDTKQGDVAPRLDITIDRSVAQIPQSSDPSVWYNQLPIQSVFYILTGVTALGIGINFTNNGNQAFRIVLPNVTVQEPLLRRELKQATQKQIAGGLVGKVFVKVGDPAASIADQVVFVEKQYKADGSDDGYTVNKVALNKNGYWIAPKNPKDGLQSFFNANANGGIDRNAPSWSAVQLQTVLTRAANAGLSPGGAYTATEGAANTGREDLIVTDPNKPANTPY